MRKSWIAVALMVLAAPTFAATTTQRIQPAPEGPDPVVAAVPQANEAKAAPTASARSTSGAKLGPLFRAIREVATGLEPTPVRLASPPGARLGLKAPEALPAAPAALAPVPQQLNDVFVFSPTSGNVSLRASLGGPVASGPTDYITSRFFTSQVVKHMDRINTFNVNQIWFSLDNFYMWSRRWEFSVALENVARPFFPSLAPSAAVAGPKTFDASTYFPRGTALTRLVNARFDPKTSLQTGKYPLAAMLSVNDKALDDDFLRTEPLMTSPLKSWVECNGAASVSGVPDCYATQSLQVQGTLLRNTGTGTLLGWRLPDPNVGSCNQSATTFTTCRRYVLDPIENFSRQLQMPDQDVRLTVDYDLTNGERAGVFFRASQAFPATFVARAVPGFNLNVQDPLVLYYAVVVDKPGNKVAITATNLQSVTTEITSAALPAFTGKLQVEVTGWNPVNIRVWINPTAPLPPPTLEINDTTYLYHGDTDYGNMLGVIFPNPNGAGGNESLANFRIDRNADLFITAKFPVRDPVDPVEDGLKALWFEAQEEEKEFFNVMFSTDPSQGWSRLGGSGDPDCLRTWNGTFSLEVKDAAPSPVDSLVQVNNTLTSLYLACCTCQDVGFTCAVDRFRDECGPDPSLWTLDTGPDYLTGRAIEIAPQFTNEHAQDRPPNVASARDWFAWVVCPAQATNVVPIPYPGDALCPIQCDPTQPGQNCGIYVFEQGTLADWPNKFPGQNSTTTSDMFPADTFVDGPLTLGPGTPQTWTPATAGNYRVYMFELGYDLTNPPDGFDSPNPDEYAINGTIQRLITVKTGVCTSRAFNLVNDSFKMAKAQPVNACIQPDEVYVAWAGRNPPLDQWFTVHELRDRGPFVTDRQANPYPRHFPDPALIDRLNSTPGQPRACIRPGVVANSVNYYAMWQQDNCGTNPTMDDQP